MAFSLLKRLQAKDYATLLNLSLGLLALLSTHLLSRFAALFVIAAVFVDAADGWIARAGKGGNAFGRELDSLADMVSFGAAPAFFIFVARGDELGVLVGLFYAAMVAVRLAAFNLQKTKNYRGLPSPAAALLVLAGLYVFGDGLVTPLVAGLLMVANFELKKIKF